jgi:CIC family chloride channel protein
MQSVPDPLPADAPLDAVVRRLGGGRRGALPVVDSTGTLRGVVTASEVEQALQDGGPPTAAELAKTTPVLRADQTLQEALTELVHHHDTGLPVISANHDRVLGWLDHRDVLRALADAPAPALDPAG